MAIGRGRVAAPHWTRRKLEGATETNADCVNPLSEEEMERLSADHRYHQLGGTAQALVAGESDIDYATVDGEKSLGEMIVSGDKNRAARLQRRIVPKTQRYQVRGRVRIRIK